MTNKRILDYTANKSELRKASASVLDFDASLEELIDDMIDTLEVQGGIGLAAPQIGVKKCVIVIKTSVIGLANPDPDSWKKSSDYWVLVNPVHTSVGLDFKRIRESCLSIPGTYGTVVRSAECVVSYLRPDKSEVSTQVTWPLAHVVQHECDHLNGVLYLDRVSRLEKNIILRRLAKSNRMKSMIETAKARQEVLDLQGFQGLRRRRQKKNTKKRQKRKR